MPEWCLCRAYQQVEKRQYRQYLVYCGLKGDEVTVYRLARGMIVVLDYAKKVSANMFTGFCKA